MEYQDPHIAAIYEKANPLAKDGEFYLSVAGTHSCSVLDLGCGTGTLCCALAQRGHRATGVDPAAAMLALARSKPYAEHVEWVQCSAQDYSSQRHFDLVIMTGHAFQVLLRDDEMLATLETMQRHLNEGGRVAFETRNPHMDWVGAWTGQCRLLGDGRITEMIKVTDSEGEFISFQTSYVTPRGTLTTNSTLRFPSREHVLELITRSGLMVRDVFGDWSAGSFKPECSREMIFVAEKAK
jgi:2-polyprenyl-3-methyl-5-hydroxy-6-metoxy-1,4-benzoquinol methylase